MMADKPVLFSGPMVRALLAGTKTQTRRTLKGAPAEATSAGTTYSSETGHSNGWTWLSGDPMDIDTWGVLDDFRLPYKVGDRLYVREHWRTIPQCNDRAPRDLLLGSLIEFVADEGPEGPAGSMAGARFRQGMHMPRWASRLTLTVTDVRVERLQDISEADAIAEGIGKAFVKEAGRVLWFGTPHVGNESAVQAYADLWDSINNPHDYCADDEPNGWEANPWVAAYTFTVERRNIDQLAKAA